MGFRPRSGLPSFHLLWLFVAKLFWQLCPFLSEANHRQSVKKRVAGNQSIRKSGPREPTNQIVRWQAVFDYSRLGKLFQFANDPVFWFGVPAFQNQKRIRRQIQNFVRCSNHLFLSKHQQLLAFGNEQKCQKLTSGLVNCFVRILKTIKISISDVPPCSVLDF